MAIPGLFMTCRDSHEVATCCSPGCQPEGVEPKIKPEPEGGDTAYVHHRSGRESGVEVRRSDRRLMPLPGGDFSVHQSFEEVDHNITGDLGSQNAEVAEKLEESGLPATKPDAFIRRESVFIEDAFESL